MGDKIVVLGVSGPHETPGLDKLTGFEIVFADDAASLQTALAGADWVFSWDYSGTLLAAAWPAADRLSWIHQAGAGVDAVLFSDLVESDVVLTNSASVFDQPIAEFVLGLILAFAKDLPASVRHQSERRWQHRLNEPIAGSRAVIVGMGGIGRATCRLLRSAGMSVTPVGRSPRHDVSIGEIHSSAELVDLAASADYLVAAAPLTPATRGMFDADVFAAMPANGRFLNVGRGGLVEEQAMIDALRDGSIAGAGLDVFATEPLPPDNPLWGMDNVIVTPHHAGDHVGHRQELVALFLDNVARREDGRELRNVVDKRLGFVRSS